MHGLRRELLSQFCRGFGIQIRFSGWPLFGRITGRSQFTFLQVLYVSSGLNFLCYFMLDSVLVLFELKSKIKRGVLFRVKFSC